jgi:CARDB.
VTAGDSLTVSATVQNTGDLGTLQAAQFRLVSNDSGTSVTEAIDAVDIAPGESANSTAKLNTTGLAPGSYTLEIVTKDDTEQMSVTITSDSDATTTDSLRPRSPTERFLTPSGM